MIYNVIMPQWMSILSYFDFLLFDYQEHSKDSGENSRLTLLSLTSLYAQTAIRLHNF